MSLPPLPGGFLVAVEGIDGAGKTSIARALVDHLRAAGADVLASKEPTQGQYGAELRASAQSGRLSPAREAELLLLDRHEHVADVIEPALARGAIVVLDRYFPSMVAYQGAEGLDPVELLRCNDFAPRPDLLLVLDIAPTDGLARIRKRGDQPNAFETEENLARCRAIFLGLDLPHRRIIDAAQPFERVLADCTDALLRRLSERLVQDADGDVSAGIEAFNRAIPTLYV